MSDKPQKIENKSLTPMEMISSAIQSGASVEVMRGLFELQKDWEKNEARKAFYISFTAFKNDLPDIFKSKQVAFGNTAFDYAPLETIADVIGKSLAVHKLSFRWSSENIENKIRVTCTLSHELGHSESTWLDAEADMSGSKNKIQGLGSSITYLQRYTLLAITGMAAKGMDTDGNIPEEFIDETQQKEIIKRMDSYKMNPQDFFRFMKIENLKGLAKSRYNDALAFIDLKKSKSKPPENKPESKEKSLPQTGTPAEMFP